MLIAQDIYKKFDDTTVLRGMSLTVSRGEVVALIGPSGSGKSTFLRCLCRLEHIDRGLISIGGQLLVQTVGERAVYAKEDKAAPLLRKMGMVFQSFNLFPHFSVLRNLTEAQIHVRKTPRAQAQERAHEMLKRVGLSEKAGQYPYQLSGGQAQRVAIARALCMDPELLLFDEPTSALDPQLTQEVLSVMRQLAGEDITMMVVTHEMGFAREVADRVVFMENGCVVEEGTPDLVFGSQDLRTRRFLGL